MKYCTTYKGVPFGPAKIVYTDDSVKALSFKAIGIFNNGVLSNGACLVIKDSSEVKFFS